MTEAALASQASCTEAAKYYMICTKCGAKGETYSYGEALGHTPVIDEASAPDCTHAGKTKGTHCSTCSAVLEPQMDVPAPGHDFGTDGKAENCLRCNAANSQNASAGGSGSGNTKPGKKPGNNGNGNGNAGTGSGENQKPGNNGGNGNAGEPGNQTSDGASKPVTHKKAVMAEDGSMVTTTDKGEATLVGVSKECYLKKSISVPQKVTVDGVSYKVSAVGKKAFQKAKKAGTVKLPKNVKRIKAYAFQGSKVTTVKIKLKKGVQLKVSKKAFKKSKVKKIRVTMSKADKKRKNAVKKAFTAAKIKKSNITVKFS